MSFRYTNLPSFLFLQSSTQNDVITKSGKRKRQVQDQEKAMKKAKFEAIQSEQKIADVGGNTEAIVVSNFLSTLLANIYS